jgi:segregation and condensation protein B
MLSEKASILESLLFASGEAAELAVLARILEISEPEARAEIENLRAEYKKRRAGLKIIELENAFQLCTADRHFPYVQKLAGEARRQSLSPAALETIAIIAYNQPITKTSVEYIRGVNSDWAVTKLVERGLAEECGRLDAPGRPVLYRTTKEFLRRFGISSLDELPAPEAKLSLEPETEAAEETELPAASGSFGAV